MISKSNLQKMSVSELQALIKELKPGIAKREMIFKEGNNHSDYIMLKKLKNYYSIVKDVVTHKINTGQK